MASIPGHCPRTWESHVGKGYPTSLIFSSHFSNSPAIVSKGSVSVLHTLLHVVKVKGS